jgi:hypothetical protein
MAVSYSSSGTHGTYKALPTQVKVRIITIPKTTHHHREDPNNLLSLHHNPITTVTEFCHHHNRISPPQTFNFITAPIFH